MCTLIISNSVHSDVMSRKAYEAAHVTYQLEMSALLLEKAIQSYDQESNPQGASVILTAFDQLANGFVQADLIVGSYMDIIKSAYPSSNPYYLAADAISYSLNTTVQSVILLQTVSKGASSAGLASYSNIEDIKGCVSNSGATACVSTIITNLKKLGIPEEDLAIVQQTIYQGAQQAAIVAISKKAGDSSVIYNSDACQAASGAIANIATHADGAITIATQELMYKGVPFSSAFSNAFLNIIADSKKNPKSFEDQQIVYAQAFNPIFATTFASLINQSAISPFFNPVYAGSQQTNAEKLIEGAKLLAQGISQFILPGSENIAEAMNYAAVKNSGFMTNRKLELHDLIYALQKLSGVN